MALRLATGRRVTALWRTGALPAAATEPLFQVCPTPACATFAVLLPPLLELKSAEGVAAYLRT
eukprot:8022803-Pyramimonas_sp.AAC.1